MKKESIQEQLDELNGGGWETIIDFTYIDSSGVPIEQIIAVLERMEKEG